MPLDEELRSNLSARRDKIVAAGGPRKTKERHDKGLMTARERIEGLCQEGTFQEYGAHVRHGCTSFGMSEVEIPADGVVVGTGFVENRQIAVFSQDFTVVGGTLGKMHGRKIVWAQDYATKNGCPLVGFKDSGGARIQEGIDALSGYGEVFYRNVNLSGVVPQIAIIAGPCAGGASYSPALMDFIIMTRTNAQMFITGPQVIKTVSGRDVSMDEVGGAEMHAAVSGNVHLLADDDAHAIALTRKLLSYLPSNNTEDPPHAPYPDLDLSPDPEIDRLVRSDASDPMDMHGIVKRVLDDGELFEIHTNFAKNLIVGFGRLQGLVVGVLANNSMEKAGCLDIDSSDKGARFIRFCNAFNIPIVTFVDVPGFLPGVDQERGGIIRHGAKMLFAYSSATVPKLTVVTRKAYGGSYLAMCSQEMGADVVFAWPTAQIAVMGAEGAVNILYNKELKAIDDGAAKQAKRKEFVEHYKAEFASPYLAAARGYITDVIEPETTRAVLSLALRKLLGKRELRPAKKHGLIPL
ncbi:Acetyl-coenzyme A carboxyl transferase alpha chain [Rhodovulum sp. PH10]|uniref:acyl-CoA carboxylase subunit beta n=1 Tax=Rhodovulum sp. PH10 TaxID=1187851 RepID=UPI00027C25B6|nr:acyl-CoA carboxylase subunit beta [Rhodovulum sp. PH10]EJW13719.1 Acetyl-coenzyme A carboxyl transferase alpha chain [Rhodovulum sp. PH10]